MPLSQKNLTLLPEVFRQKFRNTIDQVCRQESVGHLFYMNDKRFSPPDFRDGVHLNGRGAIKFWNLLVDSIKEDKLLNAQLKQSILKVRQ